MEDKRYYSITTKRFALRCNHQDWLVKTQKLYNEILLFYYQIYLKQEEVHALNSQQAMRVLEQLTVTGRDRQPVKYFLEEQFKGIKIPQYFRRSAINAAIAAGKSYLTREEQLEETMAFCKAVTYYKGMYRDLNEQEVTLKVWNGEKWQWVCCSIYGNKFPVDAEILSPSVVLREKQCKLHVPVKEPVSDGRKVKKRMEGDPRIAVVQITGSDAVAICMILDHQGNQVSVRFFKGGREYADRCERIWKKIKKAQQSMGCQKIGYPNKRHWQKLKNIKEFFSNSISRQVINYIEKQNAEIIVIPKYERNYTRMVLAAVPNWSPLRLSNQIKEQLLYKAWKTGIPMIDVNANHTSDCCAKCGAAIHRKQDQYLCENGHQGNYYMNAALNQGRKCLKSFGKQVL